MSAKFVDVPLERAMLEIIGSETMVDAAKDAAVDHLGAFQEWIKRRLGSDITPLQRISSPAPLAIAQTGERLRACRKK